MLQYYYFIAALLPVMTCNYNSKNCKKRFSIFRIIFPIAYIDAFVGLIRGW